MVRILIVDDDDDICLSLADALRGSGYTTRIATDGEAGLQMVRQWQPDLVLLDVEMPILDGPDMAYRMFIRDCGLELIPIILISGVIDLAVVAERVGTPYFLRKPFELESLMQLIARAQQEKVAPIPRQPSSP